MTGLPELLARAASVHADLIDAALPGRAGDPDERPAVDPTRKPAPGDLGVMEHRHQLVRGLRWWVDAVRDPGEHTQVGHDVALMARWLAGHVHVMAAEDRAELDANLSAWLVKAAGIMGAPNTPRSAEGSAEALAERLGVPVRTVQARLEAVAPHVCPECSRHFKGPQGLGGHRKRTHGVRGTAEDRCMHDLRARDCALCRTVRGGLA